MQAVGVTTVPARTSGPQRKSRLRNRSAAGTAGDTGTSAGSQGSAAAGTRLAGASITSNRSSRNHQDQISEQDLEGVNRRAICEDILTGGHVQTFVDFFYLTHRPAPVQGRTAVKRDTAAVPSIATGYSAPLEWMFRGRMLLLTTKGASLLSLQYGRMRCESAPLSKVHR